MKFLADESCDFIVVSALRKSGYDVISICEMSPSMADEEVIQLASKEKRVLLTEDKDFGQIFYASLGSGYTVILIRYPNSVRQKLPADVINLIGLHGKSIVGCFVVVQPGRIRFAK